jgi:hypothetical protein
MGNKSGVGDHSVVRPHCVAFYVPRAMQDLNRFDHGPGAFSKSLAKVLDLNN